MTLLTSQQWTIDLTPDEPWQCEAGRMFMAECPERVFTCSMEAYKYGVQDKLVRSSAGGSMQVRGVHDLQMRQSQSGADRQLQIYSS